MRHALRKIYNLLAGLPTLPRYYRDFKTLKKQESLAAKAFPLEKSWFCLADRMAESGSTTGHYFHQDLLVARRIFLNHPRVHVDIGSRVDGFVAHVASFRPIEVLDIRPLKHTQPNIRFMQANMMAPIVEDLANYCDSLSCLHALEHFGLGRYGDDINYDGYLLGLANMWKILQPGGKFYLSVPIGPQRIEFNAHRVFAVGWMMECLSDKYRIDHFSYVNDQSDLHENVPLTTDAIKNNFGCVFGCGIFEMTKK